MLGVSRALTEGGIPQARRLTPSGASGRADPPPNDVSAACPPRVKQRMPMPTRSSSFRRTTKKNTKRRATTKARRSTAKRTFKSRTTKAKRFGATKSKRTTARKATRTTRKSSAKRTFKSRTTKAKRTTARTKKTRTSAKRTNKTNKTTTGGFTPTYFKNGTFFTFSTPARKTFRRKAA
jgi:hypothetical protein